MQASSLRSILAGALLAAAAAPALAGNYAEGDPRPEAQPTQASRAAVASEARTWMATAPTVGYPEGNPREVAPAGQKSRAEVRAEAVAWVKSGMAQLAYGEAEADSIGPTYQRAAQAYSVLREADAKVAASAEGRVIAR